MEVDGKKGLCKMKRLLIIPISILSVAVLVEVVLRLFKPQLTYSAVNKYNLSCLYKDKILPFSLSKSSRCHMAAYFGDYNTYGTINSLGFRGKEFNFEKKAGLKRILILGDSMTFGLGVTDDQTFPYQLEEILKQKQPNTEVINAGYADGFSPDSFYLFMQDRGWNLKPDVVMMAFFIYNDLADLSETVWEETDEHGLPLKITSCCRVVDGGNLRSRSINFKYKNPILRELHIYFLLANYWEKHVKTRETVENSVVKRDSLQGCTLVKDCLEVNFKQEEEKTFKVISELGRLAETKGIKFIIAILPVDYQLYNDVTGKYGAIFIPDENYKTFLQDRLKEKFKSSGIDFIDLYPVFDSQRIRGYPFYKNDAHFNRLGNKIVAEALADYLIGQK